MIPEPQKNAFTLVCHGHAEVQAAIEMLRSHNSNMKSVSVIGRDVPGERDVVGCYSIGGSFRYRGPLGVFWEGLWELLDGAGLFWMPDLGWILIAGPFGRLVFSSLDNSSAFSGLSAFGFAIYSLGLSLENILVYEAYLKAGALLFVVHGSATTVEDARQVLAQLRR